LFCLLKQIIGRLSADADCHTADTDYRPYRLSVQLYNTSNEVYAEQVARITVQSHQ